MQYKNSIFTGGGIELFSCSHPCYNKHDDCLYSYWLELKPWSNTNTLHIAKTNNKMERTVVGSVETDGHKLIPYIHEFGMTENYAILIVPPLTVKLENLLNGQGMMSQMQWLGGDDGGGINTKIYVFDINRYKNETDMNKLSPIKVFEAPPMFLYHYINCYELNDSMTTGATGVSGASGDIVVDVTGYNSSDFISGQHAYAYLSNLLDPELRLKQERDGEIYRYVLPMSNLSNIASKHSHHTANTDSTTTSTAIDHASSHYQLSSTNRPFIRPLILPVIDKNGLPYTGELPRINSAYRGKPYRYSYAMTAFAGSDMSDLTRGEFLKHAIVKRDHVTAERLLETMSSTSSGHSGGDGSSKEPSALLWSSENCFPGEPCFVSRRTSADTSAGAGLQNKAVTGSSIIGEVELLTEDDGVLLSEVFDANKSESFLLVLDAKTMTELARIYIGKIRPPSFHGQFIYLTADA